MLWGGFGEEGLRWPILHTRAYLDCAPAAAFVKGGEEGAEERRETRRDVRPDDINAELDDDEQLADDAQATRESVMGKFKQAVFDRVHSETTGVNTRCE